VTCIKLIDENWKKAESAEELQDLEYGAGFHVKLCGNLRMLILTSAANSRLGKCCSS